MMGSEKLLKITEIIRCFEHLLKVAWVLGLFYGCCRCSCFNFLKSVTFWFNIECINFYARRLEMVPNLNKKIWLNSNFYVILR